MVAIMQPFINGPSPFNDRPQLIGNVILRGNFLDVSFPWAVLNWQTSGNDPLPP